MYVNSNYGATSATALTKAKLDEWYTKYKKINNADTYTAATFQSVYGTNYESLIDNYSYYWLSSAHSSYGVYFVDPGVRRVGGIQRQCAWGACPSFSIIWYPNVRNK